MSVVGSDNRPGNGRGIGITGTGSYLPERVLTNFDLEKMVETSDEWIRTRTGIRERHIARDDEASSDMASVASKRALASAGVAPDRVDMIVVGTLTPDMSFPGTACFVQDLIGAKNAFCFDVSAACSGFLYSLQTAYNAIAAGQAETVLVVGVEKLSGVTDWEDRSTCVLFGDGAGAVVLQRTDGAGILGSVNGSDGSLTGLLNLPAGGSRHPASHETVDARMHYLKMKGNEVFKHAVRCMCDAGERVLEKCGVTIDEVACVIPHQANMRIIQAISNRFGNDIDKFFVNLDAVGNLSAASVPVALDAAVKAERIQKGDKVLFVVFGGGFTWGATLLEW